MTIIGLYAGILAVIYILLSYRVVKQRRLTKTGTGDGGDSALNRAIRVHANFIEYVPICLILMVMLSMSAVPLWVLHLTGLVLVIARIMHALGLTAHSGVSSGRYWGTLLTWINLLFLAIANIAVYLVEWL